MTHARIRSRRIWQISIVVLFSIYVARTIRLVSNIDSFPLQEPDDALPTVTSPTTSEKDCWELPAVYSEMNPKEFMENGPGKVYLPLYEKQHQSKKRRLLKVRFVVYSLSDKNCRPVYYHIHKNGGTSMNVKDHPLVDAYYTPREQQLGREEFQNQTMQIMTDIYSAQQQQQPCSMPTFTFLRDPVPRFLSSVGQALRLNKLHPCNTQSKDTQELLDCVLNKIKAKESFLDEHLVPQLFELYKGMEGLDLKVKVMDLSAIGSVLQKLGLATNGASSPRRKTQGLVSGFNLSMSFVTASLMERICEIYPMDVLLLQLTGVTRTMCERHTQKG
jgi:hypothetical protein